MAERETNGLMGRSLKNDFKGHVSSPNPWTAVYPEQGSRGRANSHIVYGKVTHYSWKGSGNLSVKSVLSGHANVESDGGIHRIEPGSYVVINHGREYSIDFHDDCGIDGLSLYFSPKIVSQSLDASMERFDELLESPFSRRRDVEFFERVYRGDALQHKLARIHEELPVMQSDPMWVQECLHLTLNLLVDRHVEVLKDVQSVQAVRTTTKEELYRRLYKAHDYAYATLDQSISLDDLAYVACLSTNYFLRSFRGLFHQTPHQYIIDKRMDRAQRLLLMTDQSVSEICSAVGFQSLGSFSWLFKRRVGLSPEAFRRNSGTVPTFS